MMYLRKSLILTLAILLLPMAAFAKDNPDIVFSPQGKVKNVAQVKAVFREQMVPFGASAQPDPFRISCGIAGEGRWVDGRTWVYDFDEEGQAGYACSFTVLDNLVSIAGNKIPGGRIFRFNTGGPAVKNIYPSENSDSIYENQVFILTLDAEADETSVMNNVSCSVEGVVERLGVNIITGEKRKEILESRWDYDENDKENDKYRLLLQCSRPFPNDKNVALVWSYGIASRQGVKTDVESVYKFKTRSLFDVSFRCDRESAEAGCVPIASMNVDFNADVPYQTAMKIRLEGNGKSFAPEPDATAEKEETVRHIKFAPTFLPNTEFKIVFPPDFKDEEGRAPVNANKFPMAASTADFPALAKFSSFFGIVEKSDPVLPVTVRNIEKEVTTVQGAASANIMKAATDEEIIQYLRKILGTGTEKSLFTAQQRKSGAKIPLSENPSQTQVIGIPLQQPGLSIVEIESRILGQRLLESTKPMYIRTAALVTDMAAHFKHGRESSLVWVTSLSKGEPVENASVAIRDCEGKILWQGATDKDGLARINTQLPEPYSESRCEIDYAESLWNEHPKTQTLRGISSGMLIFARKGDDVTFTHSRWDDGIELWRFNVDRAYGARNISAHTILDRTLLRAGETVHMKHIIRNRTTAGFSIPARDDLPDTMQLTLAGGEEKYDIPLEWNTATGIALVDWPIPKEAKLGHYEITLRDDEDNEKKKRSGRATTLETGEFRVEDFKVPLTKGVVNPPAMPLIRPGSFDVDVNVNYLSGGPAGNMPVKIRAAISPKSVSFNDYKDFTFSVEPVKEGIEKEKREDTTPPESKIKTQELTLGAAGDAKTTIPVTEPVDAPKNMRVEMEYKDPNGETQTISQNVPLWPSSILVGINRDWRASQGRELNLAIATLDTGGKPLSAKHVTVDLYSRMEYSHRRKIIGGFYAYDRFIEIKKVGKLCEGTTNEKGLLTCAAQSPVEGNVIARAYAVDEGGRISESSADFWVRGKNEMAFDVDNNDRMDLIPEKKDYQPGETAVFQARSPFREATALVTVEREGIIEAHIQKISGADPVIKVPVKDNYGPNVFVSAMLVRGRVGEPAPTAMVDLGKPSFKVGLAEIRVGWKGYQLKVDVKTDRDVYKVRDNMKIDIQAAKPDGSPAAGGEAAVAIVDEGLLELKPNDSWKILDKMMTHRGMEVRTATAQMQVVGKRHFGLKAIPAGGGGGRQLSRELFDTLVLWKGNVVFDKNGKASVTAKLNDSVTSFRVVAVANTGAGLFGEGETSIKTRQDVTVYAGLPEFIREGDGFEATFTARNTSPEDREITMSPKLLADENDLGLAPLKDTLKQGESKVFKWSVTVPEDVYVLQWKMDAKGADGTVLDSMSKRQKVKPAFPVRVRQATLERLDHNVKMQVEKPAGALPGRGGVWLDYSSKLAFNLNSVIDYMQSYPYSCMEQRISVAVSINDADLWEQTMNIAPSYQDKDGLLKFFPTMTDGSETLTAYAISVANEAGYAIPESTLEKMTEGLRKFVEGKIVRVNKLPAVDTTLRKISAMEALARVGWFDAKMLGSITVDPGSWPTSTVIQWLNILVRADDIPGVQEKINAAQDILRARMYLTGSTFKFNTEGNDNLWWLMESTDGNAARLLGTMVDFDNWDQDTPKLARGAISRQKNGKWNSTTANTWGILAMAKFSEKFENVPVTGVTTAKMGADERSVKWTTEKQNVSAQLPWQDGKQELSANHQGTGAPWVTVQSKAAIPLKEPVSQGMSVRKKLTPVEQRIDNKWTVGDIVRIDLEFDTNADVTWAVINDPIPSGAQILGGGLGRDTKIASQTPANVADSAQPSFEERGYGGMKAYFDYLPKGTWRYSYVMRLNTAGVFIMPETVVEALYSPEMMGAAPNEAFTVEP